MRYREILIFILGTTPQIVTETIYALSKKAQPVRTDEVHLITTLKGRAVFERELSDSGRFSTLFCELGLEPIVPSVHIIKGKKGPLEDIRTEEESIALGDFIAEFINRQAGDENARLHCSIAGGRKTMSFYLGASLSIFGRPWDRLYHVLVTPEFESHPEFYWKPEKGRLLEVKNAAGKKVAVSTDDAEITLAELPFIRLKEKLRPGGMSFRELVEEGQRGIDTASVQMRLKVDFRERTVTIGDRIIEMVPMQIVIYTVFLKEKTIRCRYPNRLYCHDCTDCFPMLADLGGRRYFDEMVEDYREVYGGNAARIEDFKERWQRDGIDIPTFRQNISKINRLIKECLGDEPGTEFYTISAVGRHGSKRHGVRVEKGNIEFSSVPGKNL